MGGGFFLVLVEGLPIAGMSLGFEPFTDCGGELFAGGRDQPVLGEGFENDAGQAIALAIDQAQGVGVCVENGAPFGERVVHEAWHRRAA